MNPYQIAGIVSGCALVFAGVVSLLVLQGMPVMLAFLSVYVVALLSMLAMQRRARQSCDAAEELDRRRAPTGLVDEHPTALAFRAEFAGDGPVAGAGTPRAAVGHVTVRY